MSFPTGHTQHADLTYYITTHATFYALTRPAGFVI